MQSVARTNVTPSGTGDPGLLLRRVSLSASCTTGACLLLFLAPNYRFPSGVAPNVILALLSPVAIVVTYISYELTSRSLCNWAEEAFIAGFREAVDRRFGKATTYKRYRTFRATFLADPLAPNTFKAELGRCRDIRKQLAYAAAMCVALAPISVVVALFSEPRRQTASIVAIVAVLLGIAAVGAFRVRSITLGRAYGIAYEWAACHGRLSEYANARTRRNASNIS